MVNLQTSRCVRVIGKVWSCYVVSLLPTSLPFDPCTGGECPLPATGSPSGPDRKEGHPLCRMSGAVLIRSHPLISILIFRRWKCLIIPHCGRTHPTPPSSALLTRKTGSTSSADESRRTAKSMHTSSAKHVPQQAMCRTLQPAHQPLPTVAMTRATACYCDYSCCVSHGLWSCCSQPLPTTAVEWCLE